MPSGSLAFVSQFVSVESCGRRIKPDRTCGCLQPLLQTRCGSRVGRCRPLASLCGKGVPSGPLHALMITRSVASSALRAFFLPAWNRAPGAPSPALARSWAGITQKSALALAQQRKYNGHDVVGPSGPHLGFRSFGDRPPVGRHLCRSPVSRRTRANAAGTDLSVTVRS
jgi:hypothetical protein